MPTVHLSLPEQVYRELRKRANELGIQVTDLIKMYISNGLKNSLFSLTQSDGYSKVQDKMYYLEGKIAQIHEILNYILKKLRDLEERVEILEEPEIVPDIVYEERKPMEKTSLRKYSQLT